MSVITPVGIAGLGRYVPERRLTNQDLEKIVDTSDEWIVQRTGIRERRIAAADQVTSSLALAAARAALADANMTGDDIDLVICATVTGDQPFPATSCRIGLDIGAKRAGGFDLAAACSGFVFASQVAAGMIQSGQYKNVLVVGAEILSRILDYTDRNTCVLFGDGAGAVIYTPLARAGRGEFLGGSISMEGGAENILAQPGGGSRHPATAQTVEHRLHYMKMGGTKVFRFAVRVFAELVKNVIDKYGRDQIGVIVPHQVNQRIIEAAMEQLGMPMDFVFSNIDRYGNTSAASVPIALREAFEAGRLQKGKLVVMPAFGAGVTKVVPRRRISDAVGASSTKASLVVKIASSAPRRCASRRAAMFTAYDSVFAPSSSHGARAGVSSAYPRSRVTTRMPRVRATEKSAAGAAVTHAVGVGPCSMPRLRMSLMTASPAPHAAAARATA